ncbi:MAG TPA: PAS domain S-box protein [Methylophilaceae bacterium]|jgi:PAS domain S-box-containing protein
MNTMMFADQANHPLSLRKIRVLILEDTLRDAELIIRELRRAQFEPEWIRVENRATFLAALESFAPDLILADYQLPQFDGISALKLLRQQALFIPFLLISGVIGEETAIDAIKQGADDYLMKDRLGRLGSAVSHALENRQLRNARKHAELRLMESEAGLRLFIKHSPAAIAMFDQDMNYLAVSQRWLTQYYLENQSVIGRSHYEFFPKIPMRWKDIHQRCMAGASEKCEEDSFVNNNGITAWIRWEVQPWVKLDGETGGIIIFTEDITERKKSEAREQRLTNLNRAFSEVNQAIVRMEQQTELFPLVCRCAVEFGGLKLAWIGQLDKDSGRIVPVASYGSNLGYLQEIVVSSRADIPEGRGPAGTALRENQTVIVNDFADPRVLIWAEKANRFGLHSGASFPIQRGEKPFAVLNVYHEQTNAFDEETLSLLNEMSKEISFALDNFDHETMRKANEESLRLAASVYKASSEAMKVCDINGVILTVNPAFTKVTGYLPEEVVGKNSSMLGTERHDKAFYKAMRREIESTGQWQGEDWSRRKNGEEYIIRLTINTIFNEDGSVHSRVSLFSDLTENKEAERIVQDYNNYTKELLKKLVATHTASAIAHELNQPLAAISAYSEVALNELSSDKMDPEHLKQILEKCVAQSQRAGKNLHELLAFLQQGSNLLTEPMDLNSVVQEALKIAITDGDHGFQPVLELGADLPPVLANRIQLQKVLVNLSLNAAEAMHGMGSSNTNIRVSTRTEQNMAKVTMQDNGPGIDIETAKLIFQPFFTTKSTGFGLGLAISRSIIEANRGRLWFDAEAGPGATFHFTLPFAP